MDSPRIWGTFDEVIQACQRGGFDGIGFVFTNTPFIGIDIDGCYDEHGNLSENADQAWRIASSYTELSLSGKGLHIILRDTLPPGERPRQNESADDLALFNKLACWCKRRYAHTSVACSDAFIYR